MQLVSFVSESDTRENTTHVGAHPCIFSYASENLAHAQLLLKFLQNGCCELYFLFILYYAEQICASYRQTSDQQNSLDNQTGSCIALPGASISRGDSLMVFDAF